MAGPKGFIDSLGGGAGEDEESSPATADESMVEQHLRAFKRALDGGNMKQAASCFKAALAEADAEEPAGEEVDEEEY